MYYIQYIMLPGHESGDWAVRPAEELNNKTCMGRPSPLAGCQNGNCWSRYLQYIPWYYSLSQNKACLTHIEHKYLTEQIIEGWCNLDWPDHGQWGPEYCRKESMYILHTTYFQETDQILTWAHVICNQKPATPLGICDIIINSRGHIYITLYIYAPIQHMTKHQYHDPVVPAMLRVIFSRYSLGDIIHAIVWQAVK